MAIPFAAVIFDFDGTLVDSEATHLRLYQQLAARFGFTLTAAQYTAEFLGQTDEAIIGALAARQGRAADVPVWVALKQRWLFEYMSGGPMADIPGAGAFVRRLAAAGVPLGVGTSAIAAEVRQGLAGLGLLPLFRTVVSADMVAAGKPAPDIYLRVVGDLGVAPGHCLVFEDSVAGVRAAVNAGILPIGVGRQHPQALLAAGATRVIPDFRDFHLDQLLETPVRPS